MKLFYVEENEKIEIADVMTNHSMSVEDVMDIAGVTIADVAEKLGCDADEVDYNALHVEA